MKPPQRRHARPSRPGFAFGLISLCLLAQAASAQTLIARAPITFDPIVVTATRTPTPLSHVLADVTVLTREDIERSGADSVADLLRRAPGIEISRSGGPAGTTSLFLRGGESRFTSVLIDGVRVDSQSTGGASWQGIPLSQVERIEIVRGPASSVYGSDAISGVVQIFTRRPEGRGVEGSVGLGAGSHRTAKADAALGWSNDTVQAQVSVAREVSEGFNSYTDRTTTTWNPDRDGYRSRSAAASLGLRISPEHRLDLAGTTSRVDGQYDAFDNNGADDHSLQDVDTLRAAWTARWLPAWTSLVSAGRSEDRYETLPSTYVTHTKVDTYAWQNDVVLGAHGLNVTLERREDTLENSSLSQSAGRGKRHQDSLGVGYSWQDGGRALQLHLRHDEDSEFGGHTTGSIAGGIDLAEHWRAQASAGTGFRAPTLYQRFSEYGSATLKPESSRNLELGLAWRRGVHEASLTAYRNRVTDLITFGAPDPAICPGVFGCYGNTGRATLQGVTLAGRTAFGGVRLSASLDLQSAKDADTGRWLRRRARHHGSVRAETDVAAWSLGAEVLASAKRYDNDANTLVLGGYGVLNLDAQYRLNRAWKLSVHLDNVFDKDYQLANTYAQAGRTVFISARWQPAH